MILKIQKPLAGDMTMVLVYSKDKDVLGMVPFTKPLKRWFAETEVKYVDGTLTDDGVLHIRREVEEQDW